MSKNEYRYHKKVYGRRIPRCFVVMIVHRLRDRKNSIVDTRLGYSRQSRTVWGLTCWFGASDTWFFDWNKKHKDHCMECQIKINSSLIIWRYHQFSFCCTHQYIRIIARKFNLVLGINDLMVSLIQLKISLLIYNAFVEGIDARFNSFKESNNH